MNLYPWLVFLHIVGVLTFVMAHGASALVAVTLREERRPERVQALLELSSRSLGLMYTGFLILLLAGIAAGFGGGYWGAAWIWISIVLLIGVVAAMYPLGSLHYAKVRHAVGMRAFSDKKDAPDPVAAPPDELDALLRSNNPLLLTVVGGGGLLLIAFFMVVKPF
jgi:hypothetical protein